MRWKVAGTLVPLGIAAVGLAAHGWMTRVRERSMSHARAEAEEERRSFLRRLDHELKNPLTAIQVGLANLAESDTEEARLAAMASVQAQVLRIAHLTADLRKLSELGTRSIEQIPVDLSGLLQDVVVIARERPEATTRKLALTLPQPPSFLPRISGDEVLLLLAVHNLVDNSLKFTRPGDSVEVRASDMGDTVLIEVADTGPGIPETEIGHVWEDLYRGLGASGVPGSGLGLGLVRTIVDRHNGQITLSSQVGRGTVVTMRLPVV